MTDKTFKKKLHEAIRLEERVKVLEEVEGWLNGIPGFLWEDRKRFEVELRAKLSQLKEKQGGSIGLPGAITFIPGSQNAPGASPTN